MRCQPRLRLVIATHGEDLAWIDRTGIPAVIYDASSSGKPGLIPVPNLAREAGQWLRHIVGNYGRFADWEIFLQGDPFAHCPDILDRMRGRDFLRRHFTPLGRQQAYVAGHRHPHSIAADHFARELLGHIPDGVPWILGGQFAVSSPALMKRPLTWWTALRDKVLAEPKTSPWAMERLWLHLLNARPD
jgi:hypothetical protein